MRIKKFLLYFFLVLGILVATVFAIGKYYNQQVKDLVVAKLNERLTAKVQVGEVDLTLFDDFPKAAIRFSKVSIADKLSPNGRDTMLFAERMYLSFNFWDIWNKNYKITQLSVQGGMFHLAFDENGQSNFEIWKTDTTNRPSDFQVALNEVNFENIFFRYNQPANRQDLKCFIKNAHFSGNLSAEAFTLKTSLNTRMYAYNINGINYIEDKDVSLETRLEVNTTKAEIALRQVKLGINQLNLNLDGKISYGNRPAIDLKIAGREIQILDLMASLPKFSTAELSRYKASGFLNIDSRLKGEMSSNRMPAYAANFWISEGTLKETASGVTLDSIRLKGYYFSRFSGKDDSLNLQQFSGKFNSGDFALQLAIVNFSEPFINGKIKGRADLFQLTRFFGMSSNDTIQGLLDLNATINGVLAKGDTSTHQVWNKLNTQGEMALRNGHFKLRGGKNPLEQVSGKIKLKENLALVDQLNFKCGTSDFALSGVIHNLVPYLFKTNETIAIAADLNSKNIDLADFIAAKEDTKDNSFRLNFPKSISGYLITRIGNLKYHRFAAQELSGKLILNDDGLTAESLNLKAFNGQVKGSVSLRRNGSDYELQNRTTLSRIELDKLFYQFENFGQTILSDKNIKGKTDATVELYAKLNAALEFDQKSIQSTAQIKIVDGQLNNLEVFKDLTAYLKSNKPIALVVNTDKLGDRLKQVSFATLENTISIKDRKVIIPDMMIKSSALDININGTHDFDNRIDYGLNFRMAEVFQKDQVTENGYIVDDGAGMRMFISISGTTDAPVFKYDKLSAAQARKEKFQQEKSTFKSILKQEFGLFKSDTSLKQIASPDKGKVRFELEPTNKPTGATSSQRKPTATKPVGTKPIVKKPTKQEVDNKDYNLDDDI